MLQVLMNIKKRQWKMVEVKAILLGGVIMARKKGQENQTFEEFETARAKNS